MRRPRVSSSDNRIAGQWITPAGRAPLMTGETTFRFLNHADEVAEPAHWDAPDRARLWRYNLHYFEDLVADRAIDRVEWHRQYITRWIADNPFPAGTAWEPYPCSLRITNWCKWALSGHVLEREWRDSLAFQAEWLAKNLEWHLLGNHLFENAKALLFAGLFFDTRQSGRWLQTSMRILSTELDEQILGDGGQFELTPMYHCIALEGVLDMLNVCRCFDVPVTGELESKLEDAASRMLFWLQTMLHADGRISLFNDSAFGIAVEPDELFRYAQDLGLEWQSPDGRIEHLAESGYVRAANDDALLLADIGKIGPDYLPGHAHADSLGFEFSLFGERVFVDSGCSTYEASNERLRQRGTSAHNTVVVDGQNSSEVWSSFRVASRARPSGVSVEPAGESVHIRGSHDGYLRLPGQVIHERTWVLANKRLTISDRLTGRFDTAQASLLVPVSIDVIAESGSVSLRVGDRKACIAVEGGLLTFEEATWHPEFGVSMPAQRIVIDFQAAEVTTTVTW